MNGTFYFTTGYVPCLPFSKQTCVFKCLQDQSFESCVGKGEIGCCEEFLFSHSVLYPFGEFSTIFIKFEIVVCKYF